MNELARPVWTPARVYHLYRTTIAVVLLVLYVTSDHSLGKFMPRLFEATVIAYLLLTLMSITLDYRSGRAQPSWAQPLALIIDVLVLGLVVHANGGLESGLAVLLLVTVAEANIMLRGRLGFLIAALATLAMMFEQFYFAASTGLHSPFDLTESAVLGIAFFMVSLIVQQVASRLQRSERITARQHMAIRRLEALNQQIVARMRTGIMVFDCHYRIVQSNPAADSFLARPMSGLPLPAELVARHEQWQDSSHLDQDALRLSPQSPELATRFATLATDEDENLTLLFLQDTAHIAQQAQHLNLASLGRLSATLAHEIRNPLSAISHATELLGEGVIAEQDQRLLRMVRDHVQRVNHIISNVLDLSRRSRAHAKRFDVKDQLALVVASWHQRGKSPEQVCLQAEQDHLDIRFDPTQFIQIIDNLIGNAFAHGGKDCRVRVRCGQHSRTRLPWIRVCDNGPGVAEGARTRLFEPFFTTSGLGNGLGLYVCRQLCQGNQATLEYEHGQNGATFVITCSHPDRQFQ